MKKIDKYTKRRIVLCLIIILIIFTIVRTVIIKNNKTSERIKLIIDDKVIELKDEIYSDSFNNFYMSKEDIMEIFDPNIYYDQADNMLVTAYNKHVAKLNLNEFKMNINGSVIETEASLMKYNDKIYLPFSEMGIIYDFEFTYSEDTNTIIIDSISKAKTEGTVVKLFTKLKESPKLFGKKIERINKNQKVMIIEEKDKYYYVRSEKGNLGYVKKSKIGNINQIRENMEESKIKEINFLDNKNIIDNYSNIELKENIKNAVILDLYSIRNGELQNNQSINSDDFKEFVNWAEDNDVLIIATISCKDDVDEVFLTYKNRTDIIEEIYNRLILNKIRGVNISFDKINDVNSFYRFVIEMAPKFRESGIKTIITKNEVLKIEKLESIADFVIK